jgi:ribosomal protein L40E
MTHRLIYSTVICITCCFTVFSARAQASITLDELQIAFWPEYDRSSMLVIYRGTLAPSLSLPASLTFSIPARYGPPMAVAYSDAQGRLLNLQFTTAASGEVTTFSFETPSANFQFEYYDTSLDAGSPTRRYAFTGVAPYPIQSLILQVQQPVGASGLTATPALGSSTVGSDGLNYFEAVRNNVAVGESIALDLTYHKTDAALSSNNSQLSSANNTTSSGSTGPATSRATSPVLIVSVIVGLVGVGLVGTGIVWFARSRKASPVSVFASTVRPHREKGHPPRPKEVAPSAPALASNRSSAFCHECGVRLQPEDVFCRNCGTQVRR